MSNRLDPKIRKNQILDTAISLAAESHYMLVTQDEIANILNISKSLILTYFYTMDELRYDIVQKAIDTDNIQIINQARATGHKLAHTVPEDIK